MNSYIKKSFVFFLLLNQLIIGNLLGQSKIARDELEEIDVLFKNRQFEAVLQTTTDLLDERLIQKDSTYANLLSVRANAFRAIGKPNDAIDLHTEVLAIRAEIFGSNSMEASRTHLNLGNCFIDKREYNQAYSELIKALNIRKQIFSEDGPELVNVYNSLASVCGRLNAFEEGLKFLYQAKKIMASSGEDSGIGLTYLIINEAELERGRGRLVKAAAMVEKALDNLQPDASPALYRQLLLVKGNILGQQGAIQGQLNAYLEAAKAYQQHPSDMGRDYGNCLLNIGNVYLDLGAYNQALEYLQAARPFFYEAEDQAEVINSTALVYLYKNDFQAAIDYLVEGINLSYAFEDRWSHSAIVPHLFSNLANCYLKQGQNQKAAHFFQKAYVFFSKHSDTGREAISCLNNLGYISIREGALDKAKGYFMQAKQQSGLFDSATLIGLGRLSHEEGDFDAAKQYFFKALEGLDRINSDPFSFPYEKLDLYIHICETLIREHRHEQGMTDWQEVHRYAAKAIDVIESLRGALRDETAFRDLNQAFYKAFSYGIEAAVALNRKEQAFVYAEQYRKNNLEKLDYLGRVNTLSELDSIQNLKDRPAQAFNASSGLKVLSLSEIQKLLKEQQTLLEYHWGEDNLYTFVIQRDTFFIHELAVTEGLIDHIKKVVLHSKKHPRFLGARSELVFEELVSSAGKLFQLLIGSLHPYLSEELIVIPDAWLCYLPFEVLIEKPAAEPYQFRSHQYMVFNHAIRYSLSASFLGRQSKGASERDSYRYALLAVAPSFGYSGSAFEKLKYNKRETDLITSSLDAKILQDGDATEENFWRWAAESKMLHLATHSLINDLYPEYSFIAFQEIMDSIENERLYAAEIDDQRLSTDLVVLSSCESADGKFYRGEGLLSIGNAFFNAGVRSMVASLWNVDDQLTPVLMEHFYEQIQNGRTKSAALQEAKRSFVNQSSHPDAYPYFWAGFVLFGHDEPLELRAPSKPQWWLLLLGFSVAAAVGIGIIKHRRS
jgi:tetratricopeptide (TPR) repeat protein